jgi:hypothetical protein
MLAVLDMIVALLGLISTWRVCVVLVGAVVSYFFLMDSVPVGILRVTGLGCSVIVGAWCGGIWQRRHERRARERAKVTNA